MGSRVHSALSEGALEWRPLERDSALEGFFWGGGGGKGRGLTVVHMPGSAIASLVNGGEG